MSFRIHRCRNSVTVPVNINDEKRDLALSDHELRMTILRRGEKIHQCLTADDRSSHQEREEKKIEDINSEDFVDRINTEQQSPNNHKEDQRQQRESTSSFEQKSGCKCEDLHIYNLLQHPVWVFDITNKCMFFANTSSLRLIWNASTLDELLQRDFATDMTEATEHRLQDVLQKLASGEILHEQWTLYPNGEPRTVCVTLSGIRIGTDGRYAMQVEAELLEKQNFNKNTVRGMEMLVHLPIAVCQFDLDCGKLLYQNPEAVNMFGTPPKSSNINNECSSSNNDNCDDCINHFVNRFVDRGVAENALRQVQNKDKDGVIELEAEHYTKQGGPRWFSVALRRTRDPLDRHKYILLYSARDITEIIQARKDTTEANLKSEFMAVMAHEIRTPLHQIVGYLDLLELTDLDDIQHDHLSQIQSSASLLICIINDLLDYSKLENGQLKIENIPFALDGVVKGCIAAEKTKADSKKLQIGYTMPSIDTLVIGDPNRVRQILLNLINNAVKFTPEGGRVSLSLNIISPTEDDEGVDETLRVRFSVTDTGIGIDPSQQAIVFEKYRQANLSIARNFGGTGLGMSICKQLVKLMNGSISLQSKVNVGTTISFEIPFGIHRKHRSASIEKTPSIKRLRPTTNCTPCNSNSTDPVEGLRILVVEDNKVNQKVVCKMLTRLGHSPTVAENGQVAVDELQQHSFDLVLMDVQMPVMDGIECTKRIRNVMKLDKVALPIVGLTASFQNPDLEYYKKIGMNDCLGKPLKLQQLKDSVEKHIMKCHQAKALAMST